MLLGLRLINMNIFEQPAKLFIIWYRNAGIFSHTLYFMNFVISSRDNRVILSGVFGTLLSLMIISHLIDQQPLPSFFLLIKKSTIEKIYKNNLKFNKFTKKK